MRKRAEQVGDHLDLALDYLLALAVAVGQTNAVFDFLCVWYKVMILGCSISVAESPLRPAEPLSRGQQKWLLSNSYRGLGLSDSHGYKQAARERAGATEVPS